MRAHSGPRRTRSCCTGLDWLDCQSQQARGPQSCPDRHSVKKTSSDPAITKCSQQTTRPGQAYGAYSHTCACSGGFPRHGQAQRVLGLPGERDMYSCDLLDDDALPAALEATICFRVLSRQSSWLRASACKKRGTKSSTGEACSLARFCPALAMSCVRSSASPR